MHALDEQNHHAELLTSCEAQGHPVPATGNNSSSPILLHGHSWMCTAGCAQRLLMCNSPSRSGGGRQSSRCDCSLHSAVLEPRIEGMAVCYGAPTAQHSACPPPWLLPTNPPIAAPASPAPVAGSQVLCYAALTALCCWGDPAVKISVTSLSSLSLLLHMQQIFPQLHAVGRSIPV